MIVTRAHSVNKIGSDLLNLGFFCSLFLKVTSRRTYVLPPFWKTSHSQVHKLTRQSSATILGSQSLGGVHKHFDTNAQMVEIYTRISSLFLARLHRILPRASVVTFPVGAVEQGGTCFRTSPFRLADLLSAIILQPLPRPRLHERGAPEDCGQSHPQGLKSQATGRELVTGRNYQARGTSPKRSW